MDDIGHILVRKNELAAISSFESGGIEIFTVRNAFHVIDNYAVAGYRRANLLKGAFWLDHVLPPCTAYRENNSVFLGSLSPVRSKLSLENAERPIPAMNCGANLRA